MDEAVKNPSPQQLQQTLAGVRQHNVQLSERLSLVTAVSQAITEGYKAIHDSIITTTQTMLDGVEGEKVSITAVSDHMKNRVGAAAGTADSLSEAMLSAAVNSNAEAIASAIKGRQRIVQRMADTPGARTASSSAAAFIDAIVSTLAANEQLPEADRTKFAALSKSKGTIAQRG